MHHKYNIYLYKKSIWCSFNAYTKSNIHDKPIIKTDVVIHKVYIK